MIEKFINYIYDKKKEYIIFDIGSRDCQQSIEFYKTFPNAKIYAFECNPNTLDLCEQNIIPYQDRITLIKGAVCDYDGNITFYPINQEKTKTTWEDGNPGASSLFKSNGKYKVETYVQDEIITNCHRLDTIMNEYNIPYVDIIWMDLQGAELLALKGLGNKLSSVEYLYTEVSHKEIYTGQVMYKELNDFMIKNNFSILNKLMLSGWQEDVVYKKNSNLINSTNKNIYIHIIGVEGSGHHFWMNFIDELIKKQNKYNKGLHYQPENPTFSDTTRIYLQNISWKWNMYSKNKILSSDEELDNLYRKELNNNRNWIIFHGDSYPTMGFRKTEQNINILEFYRKYKNDMDFKFIFINRDKFNSINARKYLDGNIKNHTYNMIEHYRWIQEIKTNLPDNVYLDTYYENIDVNAVEKFLPFKNIEPTFNKIYKKSKKEIDEKDFDIMKKIFNDQNLFDIVIPVGSNDKSVIKTQIKYTQKNIIGYRNIYLICYDPSITIEGCITIDENIFPFNIKNVIEHHGKLERNKWYLQQLLKLYAGKIIPNILDKYLVIDSDTFFLKPTTFVENNKCLYNYGTEYHEPYFHHMEKLDKDLTKIDKDKSGICHHMIFDKKYIDELISKIEKNHNDLFYNIFLKTVTDKEHAGASEYEIYFNYMLKFNPDKIQIRKLNWINTSKLEINSNYDYISYHWYMR